eukprot:GHVQ01043305.1.p1 GENE.GHVQ01043305.1~~GHVQ01043305.1.p1  ORF type:complete len:222 (-),score=30.62 GHVQ01043305.1:321-986(-)
MKIAALISGGKDSLYAVHKYKDSVAVLIHMKPLPTPKGTRVYETDSYMYQTVCSQLVDAVAECLQITLLTFLITGAPVRIETLDYELTEGDEVEDLYRALKQTKEWFPDIDAVCCGAVMSNYQRLRAQNVCDRLNLQLLAPLWQTPQAELLQNIIDDGIDAIVVKTAAMGLNENHIGKSIVQLKDHFLSLESQFGFHVCGEGGEYETITVDCPMYYKRIVM